MASSVTFPKYRAWVPSTGVPAAAYCLRTFAAGTTTPLAVFTDSACTIAAANPVVLDANGEATIYAVAGTLYKFALYDPTNTTQQAGWPVDNVTIGGSGSSSTTTSQWLPSVAPTYISATSFSVAGDQRTTFSAGTRLQTTNTGGTIYCTVVSSSFAASITTVTVTAAAPGDTGTLDSGLSVVNTGILTASSRSIPVPTAIRVRSTATTSMTTAVVSTLGSGGTPSVDYDVLSEWSAGTFTCKQAGVYRFSLQIGWTTAGVTYTAGATPAIVIASAGLPGGSNQFPDTTPVNSLIPTTGSYNTALSCDIKLNAGQTIKATTLSTFSAGTITYQYDITVARAGT